MKNQEKYKLSKQWLIGQIVDLTINIKSNPYLIIFKKFDDNYFWYEHEKCTLWVSWSKIWSILESKFGLNDQEIKDLCGSTVGETLKIKVDTTLGNYFVTAFRVGETLKIKVDTTEYPTEVSGFLKIKVDRTSLHLQLLHAVTNLPQKLRLT